jgi:hypothetical protein
MIIPSSEMIFRTILKLLTTNYSESVVSERTYLNLFPIGEIFLEIALLPTKKPPSISGYSPIYYNNNIIIITYFSATHKLRTRDRI